MPNKRSHAAGRFLPSIALFVLITLSCQLSQTTSIPPSLAQTNTALDAPSTTQKGYITFVINVHDWVHVDESADCLLRAIALFEKYKVRGEFYLTGTVTEEYVNHRPDVIERLRNAGMAISYHVRPPHPLYTGFDQRLKGLSDSALEQMLRDYETYRLDPATGDVDRSHPGGYSYVASVLGKNPIVVSPQSGDARLKNAALKVYREMGAKMTIVYHEEGTDPEQPFEYMEGLLVRPSDFSVTRTTSIDGKDDFWWNHVQGSEAPRYQPVDLLTSLLAGWESKGYGRAPFITSLIHENNYYRSGPEAWAGYYYSIEHGQKAEPLAPPYDLSAPDPSKLRPSDSQDAIWKAYEELVAYAAANLNVVTSADILELAAAPSNP